jgi:hypothetical protein
MRIIRPVMLALFLSFNVMHFCSADDTLKMRFKEKEKITYAVFFNGIPCGKVEWKYLGKETVEGKTADVLEVDSDTQIFKLLNLESQEKIFLEAQTHLPIKVVRDIVFFGKRDFIEESYNQEKGYVRIVTKNGNKKEEFLYQDAPIQNILSLLYFFPQDTDLQIGKFLTFNLPTNKIKIKFDSYRVLPKTKKETLFLVGRGARRFNLWLDKESKIPLRLEFIGAAGKIAIVSEEGK